MSYMIMCDKKKELVHEISVLIAYASCEGLHECTQSCKSLHCSITQSVDVDQDTDQNLDL